MDELEQVKDNIVLLTFATEELFSCTKQILDSISSGTIDANKVQAAYSTLENAQRQLSETKRRINSGL